MEILDVYPKDWHVRLEFSLEQIIYILDFLNKCEFKGDMKAVQNIKAKDYVIGEFFPKLDKLSEDIQKGEG